MSTGILLEMGLAEVAVVAGSSGQSIYPTDDGRLIASLQLELIGLGFAMQKDSNLWLPPADKSTTRWEMEGCLTISY